jgi:hypothetical protein
LFFAFVAKSFELIKQTKSMIENERESDFNILDDFGDEEAREGIENMETNEVDDEMDIETDYD